MIFEPSMGCNHYDEFKSWYNTNYSTRWSLLCLQRYLKLKCKLGSHYLLITFICIKLKKNYDALVSVELEKFKQMKNSSILHLVSASMI